MRTLSGLVLLPQSNCSQSGSPHTPTVGGWGVFSFLALQLPAFTSPAQNFWGIIKIPTFLWYVLLLNAIRLLHKLGWAKLCCSNKSTSKCSGSHIIEWFPLHNTYPVQLSRRLFPSKKLRNTGWQRLYNLNCFWGKKEDVGSSCVLLVSSRSDTCPLCSQPLVQNESHGSA